jgi:hypothetical protein
MKTRIPFRFATLLAGLTLLGIISIHAAPPEKTVKAATPVAASNAIPQSVFTIPTSLQQGRDPFFPNSTYWLSGVGVVVPKQSTPSHTEVTLVLNGLSGTAGHRLAMINGHTMAEGEAAEVSTASGRIRVRCVEIKAESVVVEVGNERRELRLRD